MTQKVLIPADDHSYREATIKTMKVVWNKYHRAFGEYVGDDYLEDGDEVIEREVAC